MSNYISFYMVPVLVIMILLLAFAKVYKSGKHFKLSVYVALGFLLGWASAYISLAKFHLYK